MVHSLLEFQPDNVQYVLHRQEICIPSRIFTKYAFCMNIRTLVTNVFSTFRMSSGPENLLFISVSSYFFIQLMSLAWMGSVKWKKIDHVVEQH